MSFRIGVIVNVLAFAVAFSGMSYANSDYSEGVKAYIQGDYSKAQSHWLQSAKQGDAKSMFNLGLLHDQKRIDRPSADKAMEWYSLAANSGYMAANYHLANILLVDLDNQSKNKDQALVLMNKAASAGFKPAIDYLNDGVVTQVPVKEPVIKNASADKKTNGYLSEAWIKAKKPTYWTIQMLAFSDEEKVQHFIDQHGLKSKAAYFKERVGNKVLYKLVYGVYKTKIQADFARQNLSKELVQHGPWLRTIESVQSVIKAQ